MQDVVVCTTAGGKDRITTGGYVAYSNGDDDNDNRHHRGGNNVHPLQFLNDDSGTAAIATNDDDRNCIDGSTHCTIAAAMARSIDREGGIDAADASGEDVRVRLGAFPTNLSPCIILVSTPHRKI